MINEAHQIIVSWDIEDHEETVYGRLFTGERGEDTEFFWNTPLKKREKTVFEVKTEKFCRECVGPIKLGVASTKTLGGPPQSYFDLVISKMATSDPTAFHAQEGDTVEVTYDPASPALLFRALRGGSEIFSHSIDGPELAPGLMHMHLQLSSPEDKVRLTEAPE